MESSESISSIVKRGAKNAYEEILLEGYEKADKENREKIQKAREEAQKIREEQKATIRKSVVNLYKLGVSSHHIRKALEISESETDKILREEGLI